MAKPPTPWMKLLDLSSMAREILEDADVKDYICHHARNINEQDDILKGIKFVSKMMRMFTEKPVKDRDEYC